LWLAVVAGVTLLPLLVSPRAVRGVAAQVLAVVAAVAISGFVVFLLVQMVGVFALGWRY
jgi:hypothetical protein